MLRCAQRAHPRGRVPRSFETCGTAIEHDDIGDPVAHERKGDREPALPSANNEHVINVLAGRMRPRNDPRIGRVTQPIEVRAPPRKADRAVRRS